MVQRLEKFTRALLGRRVSLTAVLAVLLLGTVTPARAGLLITPTFDVSITSDPNSSAIIGTLNAAIAEYEARFADPITVTIKFQEGGGLGMSSTFFANGPYSTVVALLAADATTADDATALAHIPPGPLNPLTGTSTINIKLANLRAIGIDLAPPGGFDGTITLNTALTNPGSPGSTNQFSLRAVAQHEIDEVLGLGSSLPGVPLGDPFPEDLFRYDAAGNRSFTTNPAALAFFSIDTVTDLAQFDNQNDGGDFGDWQSNPLPGGVGPKVQDAFATVGSNPTLGVELRALDVIGYDLLPLAVPEPASLGLLAGSTLLVIGYGRSRRNRASGRFAK